MVELCTYKLRILSSALSTPLALLFPWTIASSRLCVLSYMHYLGFGQEPTWKSYANFWNLILFKFLLRPYFFKFQLPNSKAQTPICFFYPERTVLSAQAPPSMLQFGNCVQPKTVESKAHLTCFLFSRISALCYLLPNVWEQLYHILCPLYL